MLEEKTERTAKIEKKSETKPEVKKGRDWTLSIALPGSILDNAQSPELRFIDHKLVLYPQVFFNMIGKCLPVKWFSDLDNSKKINF